MADDSKTETATSKRREENRAKGNVLRSREVLTALVLASTLMAFWAFSGHIYEQVGGLASQVLGNLDRIDLSRGGFPVFVARTAISFLLAILPVALAAVVAAVVGNVMQVGFMFTTKPLEPDFSKLNPLSGAQNLFRMDRVVDLGKSILKVILLGGVAYFTVRSDIDRMTFLTDVEPGVIALYQLDLAFRLIKNVLLIYLVIALIDYATQKYQYEKSIRMSKEEVRDEFKQSEGDPQVKRRIRRLQVEMTRRRMMAEVPRADVVVTNPTHYAVALRYDVETMEAPVVVAKGVDLVAKKIIALAEEHGVTVYRAPEIARALYRDTEPGDAIPAQMFQAVAEILAHVYRLTQRTLPRRPQAAFQPEPAPQ